MISQVDDDIDLDGDEEVPALQWDQEKDARVGLLLVGNFTPERYPAAIKRLRQLKTVNKYVTCHHQY